MGDIGYNKKYETKIDQHDEIDEYDKDDEKNNEDDERQFHHLYQAQRFIKRSD